MDERDGTRSTPPLQRAEGVCASRGEDALLDERLKAGKDQKQPKQVERVT